MNKEKGWITSFEDIDVMCTCGELIHVGGDTDNKNFQHIICPNCKQKFRVKVIIKEEGWKRNDKNYI